MDARPDTPPQPHSRQSAAPKPDENGNTALGCGCLAVTALIVAAVLVAVFHGSGSPGDAGVPVQADPQPAASTAVQAPSVTTSDNPAFDLTGSGSACRMNYMDVDGQTVTLFYLTEPGEVITHVSGPDGSINRNDVHWTAGVSRLTYGFPLSQATDMGAVIYLPDGSSQSCTIAAGTSAP